MKIPRTAFEAAKCCDSQSSRYALSGVLFERNDTGIPYAVATNGRVLVVLSWLEDEPEYAPVDAIIPCAFCDELRSNDQFGAEITLNEALLSSSKIEVSAAKVTLHDRAIEGRFPRWRDLIPKPAPEDVIVEINAHFLIKALTAISAHCGTKELAVVSIAVSADRAKPIVVTATRDDDRKAMGILMQYGYEPAKPAWNIVADEKETRRRLAEQKAKVIEATEKPQESAKCWSKLVAGL